MVLRGEISVRWVRWLAIAVLGLLALSGLAFSLFLWRPSLFVPLPDAATMRTRTVAPSSLIVDRRDQLLYELMDPHTGSHRPLKLDEIPAVLREAVIATEDGSFYRNPGVEPKAILRALWVNLRSGEVRAGASTITQQLARNLLMESQERGERSWRRKLHEVLLAYHLTRTFSKDEILALYLNETYFGNLAFGVEAASRAYFGKPVAQLDLAECSLLAGLPQLPGGAYNPLTSLRAAKDRQKVVLGLMARAGYVRAEEAELALREPLAFASARFPIEAPHFCMVVRDELARVLGEPAVRKGGLRVHTTLDLSQQLAAEEQVRRHLQLLNETTDDGPGHNVHNAAVVVLDVRDGAVRAMVGSPDYFDASISGALNAAYSLRQPGSAIKPVTYVAAFERGYTPATMIADVRSSFVTREGTPYVPVNYDSRYHGPVLLRQALACSYNVVAVKLLDRVGIEALVATAQKLGISSLDQAQRYGLSLTLGGGEVQLIQLTAAYGALASGGLLVQPRLIDYVEDDRGQVLYSAVQEPRRRVLDERVAYLITDILADRVARAPAFGDGNALELPFAAAVKTGTTTDWRDNWTVGYTSEVAVGVWVGNAHNEPMLRVSGVSGAAPIWNSVMRAVQRGAPRSFVRPSGVVEAKVCAESGLLPGAACSRRRTELFLAEDVPAETCPMHRLVAYDLANGLVAGVDTPADRRVLRTAVFWPAELLAWAEEEGLPPPTAGTAESASASGSPTATDQEGRGPQASVPMDGDGLRLLSPNPNGVYRIAPDIPLRSQQLEVVVSVPSELVPHEVSLWVDSVLWHTWAGPPYRVFWSLVPGVHQFRVQGREADGRTLSGPPLSITVSEP